MKADGSAIELAGNGPHDQHEEIAIRAYHLWQKRGSPIGSPEKDWLRAKQEICGRGPGEVRLKTRPQR
jgi:hypothetical protein